MSVQLRERKCGRCTVRIDGGRTENERDVSEGAKEREGEIGHNPMILTKKLYSEAAVKISRQSSGSEANAPTVKEDLSSWLLKKNWSLDGSELTETISNQLKYSIQANLIITHLKSYRLIQSLTLKQLKQQTRLQKLCKISLGFATVLACVGFSIAPNDFSLTYSAPII
uniref:Uncharacterized protein n=1 Tax=Glossina pallidipes TaxID=7398 RepID=A0A1A9Z2N2_GLOPL